MTGVLGERKDEERSRPSLVLASGSPRRRELLAGLGVDFTVRPVDVDETPLRREAPHDYVLRLGRAKGAARIDAGEVVLAADTIVVLDGDLLGKPEGPAQAIAMLGRLAGRRHEVLTGVSVRDAAGFEALAVESTRVDLSAMSEAEIRWYVDTGEPLDKAGAYAVQGLGALFVDRLEGSYSNVVGLPLARTYRLFQEIGRDLRDFRSPG